MAWKYLLSDADLGEEEARAAADVVRSKWLSLGPKTAEFEQRFAAEFGVKHAVSVANCTAALHLALLAAGVGPDTEVLLPSYTFVASANSVLHAGGRPVFVEICGAHDLNLDPHDVARKLTPRTKAIMVVHLAGFPAAMEPLLALAQEHQLAVIEDACHAVGCRYAGDRGGALQGKMAGTLGTAGCFSFFANKNLVTGEGGMLVTNVDAIAEYARVARSHGMTKSSWDKAQGRATDYDVVQPGYNYRGTELTAALGLIQLEKLQRNNQRRRELAGVYRQELARIPQLTLPFADRLEDSAHHIFPVLAENSQLRQVLREALASDGIQTSVHYPPVHLFSHFQKLPAPPHLPLTEDAARRELTLPLHPLLTPADVRHICGAVARHVDQWVSQKHHLSDAKTSEGYRTRSTASR